MALGECTECMQQMQHPKLQLATGKMQQQHCLCGPPLPSAAHKTWQICVFHMSRFSRNREEQVQDVQRSPLDRFMEFAAKATASATATVAAEASASASASVENKSQWSGAFFLFLVGRG